MGKVKDEELTVEELYELITSANKITCCRRISSWKGLFDSKEDSGSDAPYEEAHKALEKKETNQRSKVLVL
ncbi:hypothetical protein J6590_023225 [Homalodisca vitripennis]|nr:hypothetical protein J6590_023225 [Homalodisca vitripennis]